MDGVSLSDFVQLGAAAPFCWLFWQYEKANRAEREANRRTQELLGRAVDRLAIAMTGKPLVEADHVQS